MRRIKILALGFIIFFGATTVSANEGKKGNFDYSNPEFRATVDMLSMEGHGNDDLASCNVKQLYYQEVAKMFEKGMKKQQILDYYVNELGISALNAPPKKGFNLILWITPFLLIITVCVFLYFLIRKWKKNNTTLILEDDPQSLDIESELYSSLIDEERKNFI